MRLREVGPGIGGLYYAPLLREVNERKLLRALDRLPLDDVEGEQLARLWTQVRAAARKMGRAVVEARKAQARRIIAFEMARMRIDGTQHGREVVGPPLS